MAGLCLSSCTEEEVSPKVTARNTWHSNSQKSVTNVTARIDGAEWSYTNGSIFLSSGFFTLIASDTASREISIMAQTVSSPGTYSACNGRHLHRRSLFLGIHFAPAFACSSKPGSQHHPYNYPVSSANAVIAE